MPLAAGAQIAPDGELAQPLEAMGESGERICRMRLGMGSAFLFWPATRQSWRWKAGRVKPEFSSLCELQSNFC